MHVPEILKDRRVQIGAAALVAVVILVAVIRHRRKSRPLAQVRNINEARPQNSSLAKTANEPTATETVSNPLAAFVATKSAGELPTQ